MNAHGPWVAASGKRATVKDCLNMPLDQYLRLLMWAATKPTKKSKRTLPRALAPIIDRHGLRLDRLSELWEELPVLFRRAIGSSASLRELAHQS